MKGLWRFDFINPFKNWSRSRRYFTTDSKSVYLGIEHPCGTCNQILLLVGMLLSEICGLVSVGHPLWLEDGSAICSVITQWFESLRTHNHTLLFHLRLLQPGGPGSRIYIPQVQGGPVIPPGTFILLIIYKNWIRTSQKTPAIKTNRLMQFGETVAVWFENRTEHILFRATN
jgi:hypothetical protein